MRRFYEMIYEASRRDDRFALAIIAGTKGSSPQKQGAKALFFADGRIGGTLGGGCLEAEVQRRAHLALHSGMAESFELVLDHDFGWDDGLICGGSVRGLVLPRAAQARALWEQLASAKEAVTWGIPTDFSVQAATGEVLDAWLYQETVLPPCLLWVAGAGHVARAVVPLATQLEFEVTVFDDRPALANDRFFPAPVYLRVDYWDRLLQAPLPQRPAFGLILTRGHQHDALVLSRWMQQPFLYLGMIGSRRKKRLIFEQFLRDGLATPDQLDRVTCPVGVEILSQSVDEIAVSIAAQLIHERAARVYHRQPKVRVS